MTPNPTALDQKRWDTAYKNVMSLYSAIKGTHFELLKTRGYKNTDALDFLADVEIKAKRAIDNPLDHGLFQAMLEEDPADYENVPKSIRVALGKEFLEHGLTLSGPYKKLYFRVKAAK